MGQPMPMIFSLGHREIDQVSPTGSSEEYWAIGESLTQLMKS